MRCIYVNLRQSRPLEGLGRMLGCMTAGPWRWDLAEDWCPGRNYRRVRCGAGVDEELTLGNFVEHDFALQQRGP